MPQVLVQAVQKQLKHHQSHTIFCHMNKLYCSILAVQAVLVLFVLLVFQSNKSDTHLYYLLSPMHLTLAVIVLCQS